MPPSIFVVGGFILVCSHHADNMRLMRRKMLHDPLLKLQFHTVSCDAPSYEARLKAVHVSHIEMLAKCADRGISPCLILEGDAHWSGLLSAEVTAAARELGTTDWDILDFGIVAEEVRSKIKGAPRRATIRLTGTGGGCHAYAARSPAALARYLSKRPVLRAHGHNTPCIEFLADDELHVELAIHMPVVQRSKTRREGMPWHVDSNGALRALDCGGVHFIRNILSGRGWQFCVYL